MLPIDIPISAIAREGASFIPSPINAKVDFGGLLDSNSSTYFTFLIW